MNVQTIAVLLVVIAGCTLGAPTLDEKIVGGYPVNITQVPWQAAIIWGKTIQCGGSIISKRWILTAAHCLAGFTNPLQYKIRVGSADQYQGGKLYGVDAYKVHEQFNENTIDYDFALLRLREEIIFSETVQSVRMPNIDDSDIATGTMCLVSGWGQRKVSSLPTRYLHAVEVPTVDQELCNEVYEGDVTERMFCAGFYGEGGKDACQGDSGGPIVAFDSVTKIPTLLGIVSWGEGCAEPNYPGVYSKILAARTWIQEHTHI